MSTSEPPRIHSLVDLTPENIKAARLARDWTQKQLAERIDVEQSTVANWEAGTKNPNRRTRERMLRIFSNPDQTTSSISRDEIESMQDQWIEDGTTWEALGFRTCLKKYRDVLNSYVFSTEASPDAQTFKGLTEHMKTLGEAVRLQQANSDGNGVSNRVSDWLKGKNVVAPRKKPDAPSTTTSSVEVPDNSAASDNPLETKSE